LATNTDKSSDNLKTVEKNVLEVYQKENPSTRFLDRSQEDFDLEGGKRARLFRDFIKFPLQMFRGARMLDFGCGTGERAIYYNHWGADLTMVEMNPKALNRARKIFTKYALGGSNYRFIEDSLFDVEIDGKFDIVAADGVLHHTAGKKPGFDKLVSMLKPGGFVFLGLSTKAGFLQRNLQRFLIYRYADSEQSIVDLANKFFAENLDRAEKYGHRSRMAIIYDTYVNPKIDTTSMGEILGWFREHDIQYYSSCPPTLPFQFADVPGKSNMEELMMQEEMAALPELVWLAHQHDDRDSSKEYLARSRDLLKAQSLVTDQLADMTEQTTIDMRQLNEQFSDLKSIVAELTVSPVDNNRIVALLEEISGMITLADQGGPDEMEAYLKTTKHLFRGAGGVGINFIMGYKKLSDSLW
jgi:2-polyprenyl-3-methyl-5-hydroxy-6-metoxy-1,4-benzoquinol methylase